MGTKIRTTITPAEVITVDDRTLRDLELQGLVHSSESGDAGKHKWKDEVEEASTDEAPAGADEQPAKPGKKGA